MRLPDGSQVSGDPLLGDDPAGSATGLGIAEEFVDASGQTPDTADVENQLKTGTTTVGLQTDDGVVLATDQRASLGNMVQDKAAQKIYEIHPSAAITISGGVSQAQSLVSTLQAETRLYESRRGKDMSIQAVSTLIGNLLRSGAFFIVVPVLGGVDDDGAHVYSYDALGGMSEQEYTVSGSGSQYALGVLEGRYEEGLSLEEAESAAIDAVSAAMERDVASGNGMRVATITEDGVSVDVYDEPEEIPN
ncbi:MAG: archaeal proteasome endopeptidase complex subunit beta [Halolamina sp.]